MRPPKYQAPHGTYASALNHLPSLQIRRHKLIGMRIPLLTSPRSTIFASGLEIEALLRVNPNYLVYLLWSTEFGYFASILTWRRKL